MAGSALTARSLGLRISASHWSAAPRGNKSYRMTTIAERIAERNRVWINCGVCNHSHELDLAELAARLGAGHGAMHDDLTPKFTC